MPVKVIEVADLAEDLAMVKDQLQNDPANVRQEHRNCLATVQRQVQARIAELDGYERLSSAQEYERTQLDDFENEVAALREQVDLAFVEKLDRVRAAAENPALCEAGHDRGSGSAAREDVTARSAGYSASAFAGRSPWDVSEMQWRSEPIYGRAHDAVAACGAIPDDNKAELIESFRDEYEGSASARLALALSDPNYLTAYRAMLRDPFAGGATLGNEQRQRWNVSATRRVRQ